MKDYTQKILELKEMLDDPRTGLRDSSDTNKTRYCILALFEESITQALAEDRERVREKIEISLNDPQLESLIKLKQACKGAHFIDVMVRKDGKDLHFQIDYLPKLLAHSSLDKTDKEIEEMPQMNGTLEALNKLTLNKDI